MPINNDFIFCYGNRDCTNLPTPQSFSSLWQPFCRWIERIRNFFAETSQYQLFRSKKPISSSHQVHALNEALVGRVCQTSNTSEKQKAQAQFFQDHFLAKVSPLGVENLQDVIQVNPRCTGYSYHRSDLRKTISTQPDVCKSFGLKDSSYLVLTESLAIKDLFRPHFTVLKAHKIEIETIFALLENHFKQSSDPAQDPLARPLLIDATELLGNLLSLPNCPKRNQQINEAIVCFSRNLTNTTKTALTYFEEGGGITFDKSADYIGWLFRNSYCIAYVSNRKWQAIQILPLFPNLDPTKPMLNFFSMTKFITHTGLALGFIEHIKSCRGQSQQEDLNPSYIVDIPSKAIISKAVYREKEDLLKTRLFQELFYLCGMDNDLDVSFDLINTKCTLHAKGPMINMLRATLLAIQKLLTLCPTTTWNEAKTRSFSFQIVQLALYQIFLQCAKIRNNLENKQLLFEGLETMHCHILQLLEILKPLDGNQFSNNYSHILTSELGIDLPIQAGLGKCSVNISAAAIAAAWKEKENPFITYTEGFYYEQAELVGSCNAFGAYLQNSHCKVDLYMTQLHSNIELSRSSEPYKARDISADLHFLLSTNKAAEHLTVAVDVTIDTLYSDKVHKLLQEFRKEIVHGRLNFLFFQSGVKLLLMGMDNVTAAPFYLVNNGADTWKHYVAIFEEKSHKTDTLTEQYFALLFDSCYKELGFYRNAIFQNTRYILNNLPPSNRNYSIRKAEDDFLPAFVDIKVKAKHETLACHVLSQNAPMRYRPSFGFYHPNITRFSQSLNGWCSLRLTPGIDSKDAEQVVKNIHLLQQILENSD